MNRHNNAEFSSYNRFIATVRDLWEAHGAAAMSIRQISAVAAMPVSSIYHHFGSMEHLFLVAQDAAIADAQRWCEEQVAHCAGLQATPLAFAGLFAQIIDAWCEQQRALAFAWRECQLLARQTPRMSEAAGRWSQLWEGFWTQMGDRFDLGEGAVVALRVFENESYLHMIRWRRLVDRAGLDEMARSLTAWLTGTAMPAAPWRAFARDEAMRSMPVLPVRDDIAATVADAAARIIDEQGLARLTHRAVASRTGLTLGTVSHKFRTKSLLIEAAFEGLYRANLERLQPDTPARSGDFADDLAAAVMGERNALGGAELFLATARDPALRQIGAQLRYLRGKTSRATLQQLVGGGRVVGVAEAALFSGFLAAQWRADADDEGMAARIRAELSLLKRLAVGVPAD